MLKKIVQKTCIFVFLMLIVLQIVSLCTRPVIHAETNDDTDEVISSISSENQTYQQYKQMFENKRSSSTITIDAINYDYSTDEKLLVKNDSVVTSDEGKTNWIFNVLEEGIYNLNIEYFPTSGNGSSIQRGIMIDDSYPFLEAEIVSFYRLWTNKSENTFQDGNEVRSTQVETPDWIVHNANDRSRLIEEDYCFYLTKGEHSISLLSIREPMEIKKIKFTPVVDESSYKEKLTEWKNQGLKEISLDENIKVQAEDAKIKSNSSLYATTNNTSPLVENNHLYKIRLNIFGGTNWRIGGDFAQWDIEVPADGLYQISLKYLQDMKSEMNTVRTLFINGEIPFSECRNIEFNYSTNFQIKTIGDENGAYLFYLHKGINTLRLEVNLGEYAQAISNMQTAINNLNALYREIIVITGTTPDANRDYQLNKYIPNLKSKLNTSKNELEDILGLLLENNKKSQETVVINKLIDQLNQFYDNTYSIAADISLLSSNISALGTCLNSLMEQPLKLDYIIIHDADNKLPRAEGNFFEKIWFEFKKLIISFFVDYDSLGSSTTTTDKKIEVWVLTGRDQAQVIKDLIVSEFTPNNNIGVTLKLVPSSALLPNTLTGNGPDVALMVGNDLPAQYAFRNASYDLSQFSDFKSVIEGRFYESSLVNLRYNGGVYGLPETQTFPVLFYRKDIIIDQLKLKIPNTWDDLIKMIGTLQESNLGVYLGQPANVNNNNLDTVYSSMLYQNGGSFYLDDGRYTGLREEAAIQTFIEWTKLYTQYNTPLTANFLNRFRSGDMPIGIHDYSLFNSLSMFAPEIDGKWGMALLPGTADEEGKIHRESVSGGTASMMIKQTKDPESAWEFMKWWSSTEIQVQYAREVEAILGVAARYQTANYLAMEQLSWQTSDLKVLKEQFSWIRGLPQVPGGYMTARQLNNAFRKVVNDNMNPREMLLEYTLQINKEIVHKREEFGLD